MSNQSTLETRSTELEKSIQSLKIEEVGTYLSPIFLLFSHFLPLPYPHLPLSFLFAKVSIRVNWRRRQGRPLQRTRRWITGSTSWSSHEKSTSSYLQAIPFHSSMCPLSPSFTPSSSTSSLSLSCYSVSHCIPFFRVPDALVRCLANTSLCIRLKLILPYVLSFSLYLSPLSPFLPFPPHELMTSS